MDLLLPLLRSFTIRRRMQGAILVVLLMFALIGAAALIGGYRLKTLNTEFMDHSMAELEAVGELSVAVAEVRRFEKDMVLGYDDAAAVQAHRAEWQAATVRVRERLETLLHGEEDDDNVLARESLQSLKAYIDATEPVVAMILKGGFDTAQVADKRLDRAKEHVAQVEERTDRIADIVHAEALASRAEFDQAMQYTLYAFVAVLAVVVLFVVPTTLANSRSIVGPIEEARMIARAIADGDLTRPIRVDGRDELSELDRALEAMQASLGRVVGEVRASSDGIRTASAEIASGNQDLSTRTEQAASNLQQTASSMEQITGTVRQSAEAASTANQLASSAAAVAAKGGEVVSRVVSTMDEINVSSRRIGDIIGVIDGIAFQTNILALNAAVEAARAGEQGRGFAVVAGEVRSLAQRSATAAREIKGLIDASVGKVADGARLVGDAGTTMNEIVASVQRVTDVIAEISSSTSEQSQGLGQVNTAVGHLDQMTQQNAALVEESAAAAQSLRDQAGRLAELVSGFRLQSARG